MQLPGQTGRETVFDPKHKPLTRLSTFKHLKIIDIFHSMFSEGLLVKKTYL